MALFGFSVEVPREFVIPRGLSTSVYMMLCADDSAVQVFSSGKARRRGQYHSQAAQRGMARIYQLAFLTPGIWPL